MGRYSLLQQQRKFLSTLSMRRATCGYNIDSGHVQFLSTLSMRRATTREKEILMDMIFLSTLSMRRATYSAKTAYSQAHISIHALHAESDKNGKGNSSTPRNFYPRSPCGERPSWASLSKPLRYFYPRSPCGERPRSSRSDGASR